MAEEPAQFQQRLLGTFLKEAQVHMAAVSGSLEKLNQEPGSDAILYDLIRSVHSLKGAASAVELEDAAFIGQSLEQVLHKVRRGERETDAAFRELFRQGLELFESGLAELAIGGKFTVSFQFLESVRKLM